jgi:hypothetical protein
VNILATSNKDFKIKNGLIVEGDSATVNGNDVLTSASSIDDLDDVSITTPADTQVLAYEAATSLWKNVNISGGSSVIVSATAPTDPEPTEGNQWFDSSTGTTYIYYDDFWVPVSPPKAGPTGPTGETGDPGVVISASEPESTDVLWLDSDEESQAPVPTGGTTGQVLAKSSSTDYDTEWSTLNAADISDITASAAALNSTSSATSGLTALSNGTNGITYQPVSYNAIINGAFDFWQRGTSFTADGAYTADRWVMALSGATATTSRQTFTPGQTDVPGNPTYFLRFAVSTGDNAARIEQRLENVTISSGQTYTLSFWAKGTNPASGVVEVFSRQEFGVGGPAGNAVSVGTITLTGSWQRFTKTFTYDSVSGKTIGANNFYGFDIRQPGTDTSTAAWTLDLAQVQLEAGAVATPFRRNAPSIQAELAACQRYYEKANGAYTTNGAANIVVPFKVEKRASPTIVVTTIGGATTSVSGGAYTGVGSFRVEAASASDFVWTANSEL